MRDCTVAYRHMVGHSCGSSRKVFGDCLDCQGAGLGFAHVLKVHKGTKKAFLRQNAGKGT